CEAALLALDHAPGLLGAGFGFQRWPGFKAAQWHALVEEARARIKPRPAAPIVGRDRDPSALDAARANAAGLPVTLEPRDARALEGFPGGGGVIVSNPPYGERIGGAGALAFARTLGQRLRTLDGHTAFLLVRPEMLRALAMRPTWQRRLMNGPLQVLLARYELGRQRGNLRRP